MRCTHCNGTGKRFVPTNKNAITGNGYTADCLFCNGTGEIEVTNEEYIRSCSTEELAEFLWEIVSDYILWDKMHEPQYGGNPKQAFIDWLKEKYNG